MGRYPLVVIHGIAQDQVGLEWVRPDEVGLDRVSSVEQLSVPKLVALHLVPGALITVAFVALAPLVKAVGLPPIAALLAAILLVLIPVELGIVFRAVRRDGGAAAVPYRQRLALRQWFWLVPVLIVAAFVGFGVHRLIEPWLMALFGWLPEWLVVPVPLGGINDYSAGSWIVTLCAFFLLNGVIGPVIEELYFRGYLLPRMRAARALGPARQRHSFLDLPFLVPVADRSPNSRDRADGIRRALEPKRLSRHGGALRTQHTRCRTHHQFRTNAYLTKP